MRTIPIRPSWQSLGMALLVPVLAFILACGPGQEPTPVPPPVPTATAVPTATPTAALAATPTPTRPGPIATPTPTSVAVATPTPTPGVQPKKGGTLNLVAGNFTPNFDPQLLAVTPDYYASNGKLYNNLMVNYSGSATECEICSEAGWTLENNGKSMVFNLRPGIKFHSGKELTSADVAYSLKMITGEIDGIVSPRGGVVKEYVQSIETPSKYVLRLNLLRPSPFVPKILAMATNAIYQDGTTRVSLQTKDAGTGPFIVKNIVSGSNWTLVRNPDYFKVGQPYLDGVEIIYVADEATRNAAFFTHKTQWGNIGDQQYESRLNQMKAEGKATSFIEVGGCGPRFVGMNHMKPPFNDVRMRQAVNLAVDRAAIANVWASTGILPAVVSAFMFNETEEFGTPKEKVWNIYPGWGTGDKKKQEIEQAKKLVIDAGYPKGIDIDQMTRAPIPVRYAPELVQQMLKEIGIRTTISIASATDHATRMSNLDYQIQSYIICITTRDPDEAVGQYWITGGSRNWVGYSNPEVDKLYVQMSSELDPVKRKELFYKIQETVILKDVGWVAMMSTDQPWFVWKELQGFTIGMSMHSASGLHRADRLWINQ